MKTIDFHNHYYPPSYLNALRAEKGITRVSTDAAGNPMLHTPGDINIVVPGHRDIDFRQAVLDREGVDMQVLSFTAPGTDIHRPDRAVAHAHMVNDSFAEITRERPDRFTALATLPMRDPAAAAREVERATSELGLKGVMIFSNVNGVGLDDERFWPVYERADAAQAVIYIHPTYPVGVEAMTQYWLMPLVGFTFDTTLAAASLVFSGVVERFPRIRWVLAHLGGAIPYLAERLDRGFHAFKECRTHISRPPSDYLRRFYYDTVNFDVRALRLAIDFAGTDHLLAGSDYPHQIGSIRAMFQSIDALAITERESAAILGDNTARLLGL